MRTWAAFQICVVWRQAEPVMDENLIETDFLAPTGFNQWPADQQRVLQHQFKRGICVQLFRHDLARLHARCSAVEPFRHWAFAEESTQTLRDPYLGQQVARNDLVSGSSQQGFLPGIVAAAGFLVKDDLYHEYNSEFHQDVFVAHDELAGQAPGRRRIAGFGGLDLLLADLARQLERGLFLFRQVHTER